MLKKGMDLVIIETTRFGALEVLEDEILKFPSGILGFEEYKGYVIPRNTQRWTISVSPVDGRAGCGLYRHRTRQVFGLITRSGGSKALDELESIGPTLGTLPF